MRMIGFAAVWILARRRELAAAREGSHRCLADWMTQVQTQAYPFAHFSQGFYHGLVGLYEVVANKAHCCGSRGSVCVHVSHADAYLRIYMLCVSTR